MVLADGHRQYARTAELKEAARVLYSCFTPALHLLYTCFTPARTAELNEAAQGVNCESTVNIPTVSIWGSMLVRGPPVRGEYIVSN